MIPERRSDMHILILGAYCSCNLGDAVICECVAHQLREVYPEAKITIRDMIARDRLAPKAVPGEAMLRRRAVFAKLRQRLARLGIDLIRGREESRVQQNLSHLEQVCAGDHDLAVFAGGQLFMDGYGLFLEKCVELLGKRDVPVIFNACGIGPLYSRTIEKRLGAALAQNNVIAISTRDDAYRVDRLVGRPYAAHRVNDPALDAARIFEISARVSDTLGLGIMYPNGVPYRRALGQWRQIIKELDRRGLKWELFTNGDPADEVFARRILKNYPDREARIAPRNVTPEGLIQTIAGYRGIISYRLHSHILAVSMDIPTAALVWDHKLRYFYADCGCLKRCFEVTAGAAAVLNGLDKAAAQGYDRQRLQRQVQSSRRWLLEALKKGGFL